MSNEKAFIPKGAKAVGSMLGAICKKLLDKKEEQHEACCYKVVRDDLLRNHNCQTY